jgi:hypothetical protein
MRTKEQRSVSLQNAGRTNVHLVPRFPGFCLSLTARTTFDIYRFMLPFSFILNRKTYVGKLISESNGGVCRYTVTITYVDTKEVKASAYSFIRFGHYITPQTPRTAENADIITAIHDQLISSVAQLPAGDC